MFDFSTEHCNYCIIIHAQYDIRAWESYPPRQRVASLLSLLGFIGISMTLKGGRLIFQLKATECPGRMVGYTQHWILWFHSRIRRISLAIGHARTQSRSYSFAHLAFDRRHSVLPRDRWIASTVVRLFNHAVVGTNFPLVNFHPLR